MERFHVAALLELSDDDDHDGENTLEISINKNLNEKKASFGDLSVSSDGDNDSDSDADLDDDDHPLGFGKQWLSKTVISSSSSWGRTRFSLDPPRETVKEYQRRWGYPPQSQSPGANHNNHRTAATAKDDDTTQTSNDFPLLRSPPQTFPPLASYLDPQTAPTAVLAQLSLRHQEQKQQQQQQQNQRLLLLPSSPSSAKNLSTALVVVSQTPTRLPPLSSPPTPSTSYLQVGEDMKKLVQYSRMKYQKIQQQFIPQEKQEMKAEHRQFQQAFQALLRQDEEYATQVQQQEEEARELQRRWKHQEEEARQRQRIKEQEEAKQAAAAAAAVQQEQEQREQVAAAAETAAAAAGEPPPKESSTTTVSTTTTTTPSPQRSASASAAIPDFITDAQRLVAKLVQLRASVAPFETSKVVSQRRLQMKKVVKGKVNTLSENVDKIRQVAHDVSQAITQARAEDDAIKQQMQSQQQQQIPPEMARGRRYLIDLLSSSALVRAQADGFNGPRGDGFPLASMLAMVSVDQKELPPTFAAHVYTVCPLAIPSLPRLSSQDDDDDNEALQKSLGMIKDKSGEYETFDRFLSRTEGLISLMADIMSAQPPEHTLMGGHKGAVKWLDRFLQLLPPPPSSPLPLITAPVLDGFLTRAGHMLANQHTTEFEQQLDRIHQDILPRLDEGTIGKPSATRLRKTMEGGMTHFRTTLPSKALPELYYGASGGSSGTGHGPSFSTSSSSSGATTTTSVSPFGRPPSQPTTTIANNNPFGTGAGTSTFTPFGTSSSASVPNPFGGGTKPTTTNPSPFTAAPSDHDSMMTGGSSGQASSNPFGAFSGSSGINNASTTPFGGSSNSLFGAAAGVTNNPSPFGQSSTTPFGNPSAFGNSQTTPSSFGPSQTTSTTTTTATTPFGSGIAPSPSPFGISSTTTTTSTPFGQGTTPSPFTRPAAAPSAFGAPAPSPSPFTSASPFGQPAPAPSPFGQTPASPFGQTTMSAPSPFGQAAPTSTTTSLFGQSAPSSFGQAAPSPTPFGQAATAAPTPSPFGQPAPTPSPFGLPAPSLLGQPNPSPFGQPAPTPSPFGMPAAPTPSPFGQTTPFGGSNNSSTTSQQTPFGSNQPSAALGSGGGRELCKFFAQGRCNFGANCRFSHELPPGGVNKFGSTSLFGGARQ